MNNFDFDFAELRERCRAPDALNLWAALLLGEHFKQPFSLTHETYWALLVRAVLNDDKETLEKELRYALGLPRGFAKTTLVKLFIAWLFAYSDFCFPLIVSANAEKAAAVISDIIDMMDSENYRALFGNWRHQTEKDNSEAKIFFFNSKWRILKAIGAQGSVRGLNIKNLRPDVIILEDAQDKESAQSEVQNKNFIEWMLSTLMKARSPERSMIIFIGNMYNEQCALNQLKNNKYWISLVSSALLHNGDSLWPEFRTAKSLRDEFMHDTSLGNGALFLAEMMNDPLALINSFFDLSLLRPYQFHREELPDATWIMIDPALGKKTSDDTAIGLNGLINSKGVLLKVDAGKYGDEETVERGLRMALENNCRFIAVECVGYQAALARYFERTMRQRFITGITVVEVSARNRPKNSRISDAFKKWAKQEIDVHPDARMQVIAEATPWNPVLKKNKDDTLDILAYVDPVLAEHWPLLYNSIELDVDDSTRVYDVEETNCF